MKILALDDSESALKLLTGAIAEACPTAEVTAFNKPSELLEYAKENQCSIAFLDIEVWGTSGLTVAEALKEQNPNINIVFVTAYSEYATEAFELYPSGYVMKPVTKEAIERELENLRYPLDNKSSAQLYAQTFGNFEVFSFGIPIKFKYSKTKELFAYLIDRNGAAINTNELCAVLWEDRQDTSNLKAYLRKLISDLLTALKRIGAEDAVLKRHNSIAVIPQKITCDSYEFMKNNTTRKSAFSGQYMAQYSWAEMTAGIFGTH
ncbi:MAG: response regulator [Oscillospiraceae bacterium]|nr:response regulator [Oscillospiraceae bacterium]